MSTEDEQTRDPESGAPAPGPGDQQLLMEQLRAANERLVVSSMRAQELADEAEASRVETEAANLRKDELLLTLVSHELRTPLNAILGWARLLGNGQLDRERAAHAIATIERNGKALARIIDDVLDVSRIIGGTILIDASAVDLVAVVHEALDEVRLVAEAKGLRVNAVVPTTAELVAGDAVRLQQVVVNLLSNAIKFTPPGGHVEVRLFSAGPEAVIQVSDTGIGIASDFLPQIFGRFTQADASTTRQQGGLGLGLAIVRALVERHGGTIQAESGGLGHGATFTVRLPSLAAREPGVDMAPGAAAASPPPARVRLVGVRILLVEDDPDGRDMLALVLRIAGADVVAVGSVSAALTAFDAARPDVIVSDIGMPDEDGYALIRKIRAREAGLRRTPAIALTGYVRPEDRARILAAGFQKHLRKPADAGEIMAAVAALATIREG